jgi:S1-C subfamily serine protease
MKRNPNIGQQERLITTRASLSIPLSLIAGLICSLALPAIPPAMAITGSKSHPIKIAKKADSDANKSSSVVPDTALTEDERVNIRVYKAANRAVVNVSTVASAEETLMNPGSAGREGYGSGSIISTDGYVLTNNHVVGASKNVRVTLWDGTNLQGAVVGVDPQTDLAVVKIDPPKGTKLTALPFGDSAQMEVGRKVLAIGNPFTFDRTMTDGIVSSVGRTIVENGRSIKGIIQTDAAINPGNSGGPLLDSQGKIIGINTAIAGHAGQSAGIGFAIPINLAKNIIPQLIAHHRVQRPEIGVDVLMSDKGLKIQKVAKGSSAEAAGLQALRYIQFNFANGWVATQPDWPYADTILEVDGQPVNSIDSFFSYIESKKPDQVVTLTILRAGHKMKIPVKLTVDTSS